MSVRRAAVGLLLVLAGWGCGADPAGPPLEAEVTNAPDRFALVARDVPGSSQELVFSWTMTGTQARVTQASTVAGGSGRLVLRDVAGTEVFDQSLATGGAPLTQSGVAGRWTVILRLADFRGTIDVLVERP